MSEEVQLSQERQTISALKPWFVWSVVTFVLAIYVAGGFIEANSTTAKIDLVPGREFNLKILRVMPNSIQLQMLFSKDTADRVDLGRCCSYEATSTPGLSILTNTGASVRIALSSWLNEAVFYEAWPAAHAQNESSRHMTSDIINGKMVSREQGWKNPVPKFELYPGLNNVSLKVMSVDQALIGESVQVVVEPSLSIKWSSNSNWLVWGLLLFPAFIAIQLAWAVVLVILTWVKFKRTKVLSAQQGLM